VSSGIAVGAQDAQVLQAVVVPDAVDVIEDQGEAAAAPELALAAHLAAGGLEARVVETPLQRVAAAA
jgi:hypothetical protein